MDVPSIPEKEAYQPLMKFEFAKPLEERFTLRPRYSLGFKVFPYLKLYHYLAVFFIATTFTFAAEAAISSPDIMWVHGPNKTQEYDRPNTGRQYTKAESSSSSDNHARPVDTFPMKNRAATSEVNFKDGRHGTIELVDLTEDLKRKQLHQRGDEELAKGIARDLFFVDSEYNFYTSEWHSYFAQWTTESAHRYMKALEAQPKLTHAEFFAIDTLNWKRGMKCGTEHAEGCINMPTATDVRKIHADDRHKARQIIYSLEALRKMHTDMFIFKAALTGATDKLNTFCREFAQTFFHEAVPAKKEMCIAEIINLVLGIFMALVAIISLGAIISFGAFFGPLIMTYVPEMAATAAGYAALDAIDFALDLFASPAYVPPFVPPYRRSEPMLAQRDISSSPPLVVLKNARRSFDRIFFILHEKLPLKELGMAKENHEASTPGIYGLAKVEASLECFMGFLRSGKVQGIKLNGSSSSPSPASSSSNTAERRSALFAVMRENRNRNHPPPRGNGVLQDLRSQLYSRFRHNNGTGEYMSYSDIDAFLVRMMPRIAEHTVNLRKSTLNFPDTDTHLEVNRKQATSPPNFVIKTATKFVSWTDIFGSMKFQGVEHRATGGQSKDLKMKFRFQPAQQPHTNVGAGKPHRRDQSPVMEGQESHAKHQMIGAVDRLRALGLKPGSGGYSRRGAASSGWKVHQDGFNFNVDVDDLHLRSIIDHVECGQDGYKDSTKENEATCRKLLDRVKNGLVKHIDRSFIGLNNPNDILQALDQKRPTPLAEHLRSQFSTYHNFISFRTSDNTQEYLKEKTFKNMKNSLVSKAWADQQCHLKCSSSGSCTSGCYDPTHHLIEGLYGLDESKGHLGGERAPWNLNKTLIEQFSYQVYQATRGTGYLPGAFDLNPYHTSFKDMSAVLPVCKTDYRTAFPCNCGDMYGSEYENFMRASDWSGKYKHYAYDTIKECRGALRPLLDAHPAAYLVNACNYIYKGVAPWGANTEQEKHDKGHYKHNYCMCQGVWKYFEENKRRSDAEHNENVCRIWSGASKDWSRGGNHNHQDISYINDDLENHGCHEWRKTCKKGWCKGGYSWLNKYMENCWN